MSKTEVKEILEVMTIRDLLEELDGSGIIITDEDLIMENLHIKGISIEDKIIVTKSNKTI